MPAALMKAKENRDLAQSIDVMQELASCITRVSLLSDACDRWLRDPEDPSRYDVGPRAEDVTITYTEPGPDGKTVRKRAKLSALLPQVERDGRVVELAETKHADPRDLLLKAYDRLESRLTLVAKLLGELQQEGTTNIVVSPEWLRLREVILTALLPFPQARLEVAAALAEVDG